MQPIELERYLHEHIPLSAAMAVEVSEVDAEHVLLRAPLEPNINHRDTVFGGSASALAILAAWSLVRVRLFAVGAAPRIVIQRNTVEYNKPLIGAFTAESFLLDPGRWTTFLSSLERRGIGRLRVGAVLQGDGVEAGRFEGDFVAMDPERGR